MSNEDLVKRFFEIYGARQLDKLPEVLDEKITWYFLGNHKLAGEKHGIKELVEFFDSMATIMQTSKPDINKMITASQGPYFIECQHIRTNRPDGINIDQDVTVLWTITNGRIISGRHFFADPEAVNRYFNAVAD